MEKKDFLHNSEKRSIIEKDKDNCLCTMNRGRGV
ncbi:hypothetical protein AVP43_03154 [Geobacillus stearothermophilus]|nr:hypothetical protein GARCT_00464 [Geobacillus sp. 12AMOR1]KZE92810.1 hypothetical protein AVP43_03154 [Geobacillus stearothermophilus]STO36555.1 Uncharacterised protein [[Flavobacterium] thermophilum]